MTAGAAESLDFKLECPPDQAPTTLQIEGIAIKQDVPVSLDAAFRGFFPDTADAFSGHRSTSETQAEYALAEEGRTVLIAHFELRELDDSWVVVSVDGCEGAMSKYNPGIES